MNINIYLVIYLVNCFQITTIVCSAESKSGEYSTKNETKDKLDHNKNRSSQSNEIVGILLSDGSIFPIVSSINRETNYHLNTENELKSIHNNFENNENNYDAIYRNSNATVSSNKTPFKPLDTLSEREKEDIYYEAYYSKYFETDSFAAVVDVKETSTPLMKVEYISPIAEKMGSIEMIAVTMNDAKKIEEGEILMVEDLEKIPENEKKINELRINRPDTSIGRIPDPPPYTSSPDSRGKNISRQLKKIYSMKKYPYIDTDKIYQYSKHVPIMYDNHIQPVSDYTNQKYIRDKQLYKYMSGLPNAYPIKRKYYSTKKQQKPQTIKIYSPNYKYKKIIPKNTLKKSYDYRNLHPVRESFLVESPATHDTELKEYPEINEEIEEHMEHPHSEYYAQDIALDAPQHENYSMKAYMSRVGYPKHEYTTYDYPDERGTIPSKLIPPVFEDKLDTLLGYDESQEEPIDDEEEGDILVVGDELDDENLSTDHYPPTGSQVYKYRPISKKPIGIKLHKNSNMLKPIKNKKMQFSKFGKVFHGKKHRSYYAKYKK